MLRFRNGKPMPPGGCFSLRTSLYNKHIKTYRKRCENVSVGENQMDLQD